MSRERLADRRYPLSKIAVNAEPPTLGVFFFHRRYEPRAFARGGLPRGMAATDSTAWTIRSRSLCSIASHGNTTAIPDSVTKRDCEAPRSCTANREIEVALLMGTPSSLVSIRVISMASNPSSDTRR
jgi:hypothetical protein